MGSKVWHMFLLLALAMVAECTKFDEVNSGIHHRDNNSRDSCIGEHCNIEDDIFMDSETNIRLLAARNTFHMKHLRKQCPVPPTRTILLRMFHWETGQPLHSWLHLRNTLQKVHCLIKNISYH
ncbi:hypothetical protein ERO13_A06G128802v2 [Gossypium hirsutum]|nr:hypothetical protein ERO13_A06G128802v2 [Gossypium hirsutum]